MIWGPSVSSMLDLLVAGIISVEIFSVYDHNLLIMAWSGKLRYIYIYIYFQAHIVALNCIEGASRIIIIWIGIITQYMFFPVKLEDGSGTKQYWHGRRNTWGRHGYVLSLFLFFFKLFQDAQLREMKIFSMQIINSPKTNSAYVALPLLHLWRCIFLD